MEHPLRYTEARDLEASRGFFSRSLEASLECLLKDALDGSFPAPTDNRGLWDVVGMVGGCMFKALPGLFDVELFNPDCYNDPGGLVDADL